MKIWAPPILVSLHLPFEKSHLNADQLCPYSVPIFSSIRLKDDESDKIEKTSILDESLCLIFSFACLCVNLPCASTIQSYKVPMLLNHC